MHRCEPRAPRFSRSIRAMGRRVGTPRAFSIIELVVGMAAMSVLVLGTSSAIILSSRALPTPTGKLQRTKDTRAALDQVHAELALAVEITELTATTIAFTVADRGHGDPGSETIRYSWSGTAGQPLYREYNGGDKAILSNGVTRFALTSTPGAGTLTSAPRVGLIVNSTGSPSADETARITKLTEWGFPVTLISSWASQNDFDEDAGVCDVLYITDEAASLTLFSRFGNPAVGLLSENLVLFASIGVAGSASARNHKTIDLLDATHEITGSLAGSSFGVLAPAHASKQAALHFPNPTIAPGAVALGGAHSGGTKEPCLYVIEVGGQLHTNTAARSRRVAMPWGGQLLNLLNFAELSAESRTLLKRSLVWAAAPVVYQNVRVRIELSGADRADATITLLNTPRVPLR